MTVKELVDMSLKVRENAYAPFSKFRVGAVLVTENGKLFTGVNVENSSFGATCCAERTAIFKAVSEGERKFSMLIISSDSDTFTLPCGICRQVIAEFVNDDFNLICSDKNGNYKEFTFGQILPEAFRLLP